MAEDDVPESMTIVAWSGDLDRMWPTLILGSTGAAYGMRTTIFFTFWGLSPWCATTSASPARTR